MLGYIKIVQRQLKFTVPLYSKILHFALYNMQNTYTSFTSFLFALLENKLSPNQWTFVQAAFVLQCVFSNYSSYTLLNSAIYTQTSVIVIEVSYFKCRTSALFSHSIHQTRMELHYFVNLMLIFAVNVLFFLLGICLNSLVILSFWRSVQLRKKLCYSW
jgi:hypothetical protein